MTCKMCKERGQTWSGSAPNCYFDEPLYDNWNCATVNAIRDICDEWSNNLPKGVVVLRKEDSSYALISLYDIESRGLDEGECLFVQWYKNRGRTERLLLLGEYINREPGEEGLLAIINYYKEK